MSLLLCDLQAFYLEHEYCGELDGGVEGEIVWMICTCGAGFAREIREWRFVPSNPTPE